MTNWLSARNWTERVALAVILLCAVATLLLIPSVTHPVGSDWAQYFTVAEIIWQGDPHLYPPFRKPMYGVLLGGIGEGLGYFEAAQLIGKISAITIVICAGLGAWALVGPVAAMGAAFIAMLMPLIVDGGLWINNYPLLSACSSVALASGAALCRWPRNHWALLAGISTGLALTLDVRGLAVLPVVVGLFLTSLPGLSARRGLILALLLAAPVGSLDLYDGWLTQTHSIPQFTLEAQTQRQRQTVIEPIARGQYVDNPELAQACRDEDGPGAPPWLQAIDFWTSDSCARALRTYSAQPLQAQRILPSTLTLWLFPLVLLPMAWRSRAGKFRSSVATALVFGIPVLWTAAGMGWVFYFDRYLMPLSAVIAMAIPVGLGRAAGLLGAKIPNVRWLALGGTVAWGLWIWPGHDAHSLNQPENAVPADRAAGIMADWARDTLSPGDRIFDCGGLAFDYLLLPTQIDYTRHPPGDQSCDALIARPGESTGRTYLVTLPSPGQSTLSANPTQIRNLGWNALPSPPGLTDYQIWVQ